jgi:hypothetical protein
MKTIGDRVWVRSKRNESVPEEVTITGLRDGTYTVKNTNGNVFITASVYDLESLCECAIKYIGNTWEGIRGRY